MQPFIRRRTTTSANATQSSAGKEADTKRWSHQKATSPNKSNRKGRVLWCAVVLMCFTLWNRLHVIMMLHTDVREPDNNAASIASQSQRTNSSMAACLLMKDDNHHLIEWIAYHYLVLPLRYLVIVEGEATSVDYTYVCTSYVRSRSRIV